MKRALVVDDNEQNLYYLKVLLGAHGFAVETARHGAEALVLARRNLPDMVISDLLMPVMDGYTLLRHWKHDPMLRHVPFVVYTATDTEPEDERLALEMGADAFILKPAEPEEFMARIGEIAVKAAATVMPAESAPGEDPELMQSYSRTLIRKLEEKSLQLEDANRALQHELTELGRVEAALRASEHELRALAEAMPQMVWMTTADGANIYFNQRWVEYTGMSVEASRGDRWVEPFHPDDKPMALLAWKEATDGLSDYSVECRLRRGDGTYRWMLVRGLPYRDETGQIVKWMGTCTDIEELKRNEEVARHNAQDQRRLAVELEAERARLVAAQEVSKVGSWETDLASLKVTWSMETYRIFGASPDEFVPAHAQFLAMVHPDDQALVDRAFSESVATGSPGFIEHRIVARDGQVKFVEERWRIVAGDATGDGPRAVGTCQDVTERQALQARLRQAQRLESVGQLTGGIAHDFNNLLTVILGNSEILAEKLAHDTGAAHLAQMVVDAAERGAQLAQRLLAFGRKQALEPRSVNLNDLVTGMDALLRRTLGEHIEIAFAAEPGLWNALVDPAQLDNALLNLCLNARDAMPGGGRLRIETSNADMGSARAAQDAGLKPGHYVMLAVSDSGTGIAPEHLGRVFEPFFTTKEVGKGTGLGLAMIYGFVKQSGGHVSIDSRPGAGTTVRLYLPRTTSEPAQPALPAQTPAPAAGKATILLVEDDDLVRRYAHDQLVALGYQVVEASTGMRALDILGGSTSIELLFTDVVMPGMSGRVLAEQARKIKPDLKVLYSSGYSEDAIVTHGQLDPGVQLLAKPYRREELASKVNAALQQQGSARS